MALKHPAIAIDLAAESPIYQQIADELRLLIARHELKDGELLPSVRELGGAIGVNLNTVARAYRMLADEGLIDLRHGAAARVRSNAPQKGVLVDETDRRRLDDLISRWVLRGADRRAIKSVLDDALDRYFQGAKS